MSRANKAIVKDDKGTNESRLLAAAIRCIAKFGLAKTFIDDIAKEAGLSRPTAYRAFRSRSAMLEKIAELRTSDMVTKLKPRMAQYRSFEEALMGGTVASMQLAKQDKIYMAVILELADNSLERYMLHPESPVRNHIASIWGGTILRAKDNQELRDELSSDDVITWIIAIQCLLVIRNEWTAKGEAAFLRKFMVPTLVAPKCLTRAKESGGSR